MHSLLEGKGVIHMSTELVSMPEQKSSWSTWQAGVQNTEPEQYGTGQIVDRGLYYQERNGGWQTVWEQGLHGTLDDYNRRLNAEGIVKIHRAYRAATTSERLPGKIISFNVIATKQAGWPADKLKVGDEVSIWCWVNAQRFVQIGYKKGG